MRRDRALAATLHALVDEGGASAFPAPGYLALSFANVRVFETSRVELSSNGDGLLRKLVPLVTAIQAADVDRATVYTSGPVLVSGFPASWPLSDARASLVVDWLEANGVDARCVPPTVPARAQKSPALPEHRIEIKVPASEALQHVYFALEAR